MLAILEFALWLFIFPCVLFGFVLGHITYAVAKAFEPRILLLGIWFATVGIYLMPNRVPDDKPFVSLVDSIAQSHIFGVSTPIAMVVVAAALLVVSAFVAVHKDKGPKIS